MFISTANKTISKTINWKYLHCIWSIAVHYVGLPSAGTVIFVDIYSRMQMASGTDGNFNGQIGALWDIYGRRPRAGRVWWALPEDCGKDRFWCPSVTDCGDGWCMHVFLHCRFTPLSQPLLRSTDGSPSYVNSTGIKAARGVRQKQVTNFLDMKLSCSDCILLALNRF